MEADMSFGEHLKRLREKAGLSQSGLAEKSGISLDSIQNWESDRYQPRLDALVALADTLGVSLDELMRPQGNGQGRKKK
jgi:transcriptional regulator with XRE-family HTH domain